MIRPIPFFLLAAFIAIAGNVSGQSAVSCKEIMVEYKTEQISFDKSKVILQFGPNHHPKDFTLFLFGAKRYRRLNFSTSEIIELSKGAYVLVIQNKTDESFCTKQVNLKLD